MRQRSLRIRLELGLWLHMEVLLFNNRFDTFTVLFKVCFAFVMFETEICDLRDLISLLPISSKEEEEVIEVLVMAITEVVTWGTHPYYLISLFGILRKVESPEICVNQHLKVKSSKTQSAHSPLLQKGLYHEIYEPEAVQCPCNHIEALQEAKEHAINTTTFSNQQEVQLLTL